MDAGHRDGMSDEAKFVTLGALAFSALTGVLISTGKTRIIVAVGGSAMTLGTAYAMFFSKPGSK